MSRHTMQSIPDPIHSQAQPLRALARRFLDNARRPLNRDLRSQHRCSTPRLEEHLVGARAHATVAVFVRHCELLNGEVKRELARGASAEQETVERCEHNHPRTVESPQMRREAVRGKEGGRATEELLAEVGVVADRTPQCEDGDTPVAIACVRYGNLEPRRGTLRG